MDHAEVLALFDRQMRREAVPDGPGARVERAGAVVRQSGGPGDWNGVLWSRLDADTADAEIAAQKAHFASLGRSFEWKLYAHDTPAGLGARLAAAGLSAEPPETLMIAATDAVVDAAPDVRLPDGVRLVPVTDGAGVDLMGDVHERVFGTSGRSFRDRLARQLVEEPDTVSAVLATADGVPVCAARMELPPGKEFASLWGGGTLPQWRGRGIYRALVARRARIAARRGYRFLQVDASDDSRPILERLGFRALTTTTPYVYEPDA
ncbi:GNAT family N-acetyltransferase [Streptomyces fuscigenes]|uniref:GNAT family N-acetyltransferase n=1 Tax=Streptomyces fuscigenes TaxID=1528880 RepID=UPI001F2188D6|nr:GNAT family N-acetyltransferase [Streptomyces fuscigenes]MCF3962994.1 GNAT family N-acetyltransferase [Streptomyces fuscigenes]